MLLVLHTNTHIQRVYTGYTAGGGLAGLDLERGKRTVNRFSLFVDWTAPAGRHAGRRRYAMRDSSSSGGTRLVQATPWRLSPAPQRQCATSYTNQPVDDTTGRWSSPLLGFRENGDWRSRLTNCFFILLLLVC